MPSSRRCGSPSITARSMNAPGSPSSALQIRYLRSAGVCWAKRHLRPVGKPPPPRPRRPLRSTKSQTLGRGHAPAAPAATGGSRRGPGTRPGCAGRSGRSCAAPSAVCGAKNGCSPMVGTPSHDCSPGTGNWNRGSSGQARLAQHGVQDGAGLLRSTRPKHRRVRPGSCTSSMGSLAHRPMQPTSTIPAPWRWTTGKPRTASSTAAAPAPRPQVPVPIEDHRTGDHLAAQFGSRDWRPVRRVCVAGCSCGLGLLAGSGAGS